MKKRYVFSAFKVLIALIIAIALTKIAFFPDQKENAGPELTPDFLVTTPTVTVEKGDISNTVDVSGLIVEDSAVTAPATLNGTVNQLWYNNGDHVEAGEPILTIKNVKPQDPIEGEDDEGNPTIIKRDDIVTWQDVKAPISGTVHFMVIKDQETSVGTTVATVSPGTYSAKGTLTPAQQYRLTNAPTQATITVEGGPAPFTCPDLTIGTNNNSTKKAPAESTDSVPAGGDSTSVEVRCSVPLDQKVFPGLKATISIDSGSATDALLLPVSAVEGSFATGDVWVVPNPDDPSVNEKRSVTLGLTDGVNVQITDGLAEGDTVLKFVPGKDVKRKGKPNTCEDDYSVCYDENGDEIV